MAAASPALERYPYTQRLIQLMTYAYLIRFPLLTGAQANSVDTTVQLAWVIGGFVGIAMPLNARLGLSVAGIVLVAWTVFVLGTLPRKRGSTATPATSA